MGGRKQKFREPKPGIYIIGEGKTEKFYFEHLKKIFNYQYFVKPRFFGKGCADNFKKIISNLLRGGIQIICVFDADQSKRVPAENKKLQQLINKYHKNKNVLFCDSMPSIEYWFLLHFEDICPDFGSSGALNMLKKYIPRYEKTESFLNHEKWIRDMSLKNGSISNAETRARKYKDNCSSYSKIYLAISIFNRNSTLEFGL